MTTPGTAITVAPAQSRRFTRLVRDAARCMACAGVAHVRTLGAENGPLDARVLFIAEAPGRRGAAITGVPLTRDEAGRRFGRFLALAGIAREDCFVTNAVLCNPLDARGHNRTPSAAERARCLPHLARTLEIVRAPVVATLGRVALEATRAIERHEGALPADAPRAVTWRGRTLVALYHPGRQSTLHRREGEQEADWRALGRLVQAIAGR